MDWLVIAAIVFLGFLVGLLGEVVGMQNREIELLERQLREQREVRRWTYRMPQEVDCLN
jgi:hypothetical protein